MSTMSDLGRFRHGGWRGRHHYGGGGYPWWWFYQQPIYEVSPIGPLEEEEVQTLPPDASTGAMTDEEKLVEIAKRIAAAKKAASAKKAAPALGDHGWPAFWRLRQSSTPSRSQNIGLGQFSVPQYTLDFAGPGARDGDIDREAGALELVDEAVPAQQALLWRQAAGLVGMSDATITTTRWPTVNKTVAIAVVAVGASVGVAAGNALGRWLKQM